MDGAMTQRPLPQRRGAPAEAARAEAGAWVVLGCPPFHRSSPRAALQSGAGPGLIVV